MMYKKTVKKMSKNPKNAKKREMLKMIIKKDGRGGKGKMSSKNC